jgi:hypothetical protein
MDRTLLFIRFIQVVQLVCYHRLSTLDTNKFSEITLYDPSKIHCQLQWHAR